MENDAVIERRLDLGSRLEFDAVELGSHIAQRFDAHLEPESHFEGTFARPRALQLHFVGIPVHPHENLRERNILLGVEIVGEILVGEQRNPRSGCVAPDRSGKIRRAPSGRPRTETAWPL